MFDPDFDPLTELKQVQSELAILKDDFMRLVASHNAQAQLLHQIANQNTEILNLMTIGAKNTDTVK